MSTMASPAVTVAGDVGADPMLELLQQLGAGDPRMQLLAEMYRIRQATPPARPEPDPAVLAARHARLREAYGALRGQYERLAAALGACARCWGEDSACRYCGGDGGSGWDAPDRESFARYVLPAVRRVQIETAGTARAPGAHHATDQLEG